MGKIAFAMSLSLSLFVGEAAAREITCDAGVTGAGTSAVHHRLASEGRTSRQRRATSSVARALAGSERIDDVQRPLVGNCIGVLADNAGSAPKEGIERARYKPKTKYDNTPWRFDMQQNGKRMSADEFDAWMKARGVRIAKGAPVAVAEEKPARRTRRRD